MSDKKISQLTLDAFQAGDMVPFYRGAANFRADIGTFLTGLVNAKAEGCAGNGSTNDTTAMQAALTKCNSEGKDLFVPAGTYMVDNITVPAGVSVHGAGWKTVLKKRANGPVLILGRRSHVRNLAIEGNSAGFTGVGIQIPATIEFEGEQQISGCRIYDTASYAVEYSAEYAGYGSYLSNCELKPAATATYAVKWGVETAGNHHGDRAIVGCNIAFNPIVDATGSQAGLILGNVSGGLGAVPPIKLTSTSEKIVIVGNRLIGDMDLLGSQHTVVGNISSGALNVNCPQARVSGNVFSAITLTAGCALASVSGNQSAANADNSGTTGANTNYIDIPSVSYTPTWTGSVSNPSIGNGTLLGTYSRKGKTVTANITMVAGSTTTFGSGQWFFALPFKPAQSQISLGVCRILDSGTVNFTGTCQTAIDGTTRLLVFSTDFVTPTVPMTWAVNDSLWLSITYEM